jgi:hypothetical protein
MLGSPRIDTSTGNVIRFSTSAAPSPGGLRHNLNDVGVTSGETSMGSITIARSPIAAKMTIRMIVMRRFPSAVSKILLDITCSVRA